MENQENIKVGCVLFSPSLQELVLSNFGLSDQKKTDILEISDPENEPWLITALSDCDIILCHFSKSHRSSISSISSTLAEFKLVPKVFIMTKADDNTEAQAYRLGASEVCNLEDPVELLQARLSLHIRHKRNLEKLNQLAQDRELFAAGVLHDIKGLEAHIVTSADICTASLKGSGEIPLDDIENRVSGIIKKVSELGIYATDVIENMKNTGRDIGLESTDILQSLNWVLEVLIDSKERVDEEGFYPCAEFPDRKIKINTEGLAIKSLQIDPRALQMCLLNIFQNVIKYGTTKNRALIDVATFTLSSASLKEKLRDNPSINDINAQEGTMYRVISIRDYGPGINSDELGQVFQLFHTGSSESQVVSGDGLGLSMVRNVINNLSGLVWTESPSRELGFMISIAIPETN